MNNNTFIPKDMEQGENNSSIQSSDNKNKEVNVTDKTNDANSNVIFCTRCGKEMKRDARYCMKCGRLNYAHPDNEFMRKYAIHNMQEINRPNNATIRNVQVNNVVSDSSSPAIQPVINNHPFRACTITNLILYLLSVGLFCLFPYLKISAILTFAFIYAIFFFLCYSVQRMYIKAGEHWWALYVPFYGPYIMYKIAFGNGVLMFTGLIPIAGPIIGLVAIYNLGEKFYKNGILTVLFPYVMIPIIAFDKNTEFSMLAKNENNILRVSTSNKTSSEKAYGTKKLILSLIVILMVLVAIIMFISAYFYR